jgi:hypothetical protein
MHQLIEPLVGRRGGSLISRLTTTAVAFVISNLVFAWWPINWWPQSVQVQFVFLNFALFPYFAQAIGGAVGVITDQIGHVVAYSTQYDHAEISQERSHFYLARILLAPIGLVTFVVLYQKAGWSFFESSLVATVVGWAIGFPIMDALMRKRLRSLPARTLVKTQGKIKKVLSK